MSQIDPPQRRGGRTGSQEWKLLPLLAVPVACCALPAMIASLAAIGALAWALGLGVAAAAATPITIMFIVRSRSSADCRTDQADRPLRQRP